MLGAEQPRFFKCGVHLSPSLEHTLYSFDQSGRLSKRFTQSFGRQGVYPCLDPVTVQATSRRWPATVRCLNCFDDLFIDRIHVVYSRRDQKLLLLKASHSSSGTTIVFSLGSCSNDTAVIRPRQMYLTLADNAAEVTTLRECIMCN